MLQPELQSIRLHDRGIWQLIQYDKEALREHNHTITCTFDWIPPDACDALSSLILAHSVQVLDNQDEEQEARKHSYNMEYLQQVHYYKLL